METWDAITARRNVREFAGRAIPDADLDRVLEAGPIAPSTQKPPAVGVRRRDHPGDAA